MQLDDAFPTPWKRVASADHRPLNALEPGAWERASAAAPGLFTNDVHAMTTGGARPQAAAPAANSSTKEAFKAPIVSQSSVHCCGKQRALPQQVRHGGAASDLSTPTLSLDYTNVSH